MRLLPTSPAGIASFWAALSLIAMLPLAAALDPSGSTEPGGEADSRMTAPVAAQDRRPEAQRTDISDSGQLSPDGSSSIDTGSPGHPALADAGTAPASRKEPLKLTPARPSLTAATQQTRWSQLTDVQRNLLAPFEDQWSELTVREKQALAHMAQRFPEVPPDDQARSMKRLAAWAELTPEDRRLARYSYRWMQQLDRSEVLAAWEQYQSLTPAQRAVLAAAGNTSTTAATHPGRRTGLAADAAQPLPRRVLPAPEIPGL